MGPDLGYRDYEVVALAAMLFGRRAVVYDPINILDAAQRLARHSGCGSATPARGSPCWSWAGT
jgi:hypothetical protein